MKFKLYIILGLIAFSFKSFSQEIKVLNGVTLQGIANVKIKTKNQVFNTDENGKVNLEKINKNEQITFMHPLFNELQINIDSISKNKFRVYLFEKAVNIDEVIVSANRFKENSKDIAQSVHVIKKEDLENMNQSSTADVIANTGKIMVQKSQLGGGSPIIRGFETNKVLMVVDGVRMNNAIYRGGHIQNIITLDNSMMDKVEIVFGPGSTVYGSDALGGVMHFHTKNPILSSNDKLLVKSNAFMRYMSATDGYAGHADVSVGSNKFGSLTSFTYTKFGDLKQGANREPQFGSFGAKSWYVQQFNGVDSMVVTKDTNTQRFSGYTQYDILQKFVYKQSDNIKHKLNLQYSTSSDVPRYDRLTQMSGSKPKYAEWYYGPQKRLLGSYTLELSNKNIMYDEANIILAYQQIEESRIDRKFKKTAKNHRIENLDIITFNGDFAKKVGNHEIRYGVDVWYDKVKSTAYTKDIITGEQKALDTRYASGGATMNSAALYITHSWEISKKLILNDGLRFTNVGLKAKFTDTTFFKFPFKDAKQNNNALTGNIGLVYLPTDNTKVSVLFSTGFRSANVDDLSKVFESTPGNIIVPNTNLKPEYTYNYELGLSHLFNNGIQVSATGYYTWYTNALTVGDYKYEGHDSIMYNGTYSKVVAMTNASKAYMYGLELAINGDLNKNLNIYATYNYTHARIVTDTTAIPLDHIPPAFGKVGFQIKEKRLRADFFVNYSFWKRIADYNPFGEDNQTNALPEGMPAWYTINARLSYQFNRFVSLQVACENILDRNYRVFSSNISAPGRNFIITLRGNF